MPILVCPTCGRQVGYADRSEAKYRPFCSARCQWADLAKWLNGEYAIGRSVDAWDDEGGFGLEIDGSDPS